MVDNIYRADELRKSEKIQKLIQEIPSEKASTLKAGKVILKSSTDTGVMRNLGRNGSKYGPKAIIHQFSQMSFQQETEIYLSEVSNQELEKENFNLSQERESQLIQKFASKEILHLGGGHDHVYPLLKAIDSLGKKIIILNIDAHCDTRQSTHSHSGTGFRQFLNEAKNKTLLYQFGVHFFANSPSTLNIDKEKMKIYSFEEKDNLDLILKDIELQVREQEAYFFLSLDADALCSSIMEGVSAINHEGLSLEEVKRIFRWYKNLNSSKSVGIYEYNPLFDPTTKGARALARLIHLLYF